MNSLEIAAKYICTSKCGLCPMVVEEFQCPKECRIETRAWQCWMTFLRQKSVKAKSEVQQLEIGLMYEGLPHVINW
jgi:hypothetical protein